MAMETNQDLQDARSLLEQSGTEDERRKYRKAAEIILLKALHQDPENKEAKILLQSARATFPTVVAKPPEPKPEVPSGTEPELFKNLQPQKKKSGLKLPMGVTLVVLIGGGLLWMMQSHPGNRVTLATPVERIEPVHQSDFHPAVVQDTNVSDVSPEAAPVVAPADANPKPVEPSPVPVATAAVSRKPTTPPVVPEAPRSSTPKTPVVPETPRSTPKTPVVPEAPRSARKTEVGTLAVSSPIAADIYQNGQLVGSTPATLQLPAGQQTLEYRHAELRTVVTHEIKPNETTAASVSFDIVVQINAKPWAQVFLDGSTRRPLGQTPLSGVSVPIGGTLVFENPNFPPKTHRIMEKDATIQSNFP